MRDSGALASSRSLASMYFLLEGYQKTRRNKATIHLLIVDRLVGRREDQEKL